MLTVDELDRHRADVHRVNHDTYKGLLSQVHDRIRARAANGVNELVWQVPPLVLGRPVFKVEHAARYVRDKLRIGGFAVHVIPMSSDVYLLYISWSRPSSGARESSSTPSKKKKPRVPVAPKRPVGITPSETSRRVEQLRAHLRLM